MRRSVLSAWLLLIPMGMAAQGPPATSSSKLTAPQAVITASVSGLNCSTSAGTNLIAIQGWSWGAAASSTSSGSSGGAQASANVSGLTLEKSFDGCSPALFGATVSGKTYAGMTLVQEDSNHNIVLTLQLSNVLVTSWTIAGSTSAALPVESVSVGFQKVCIAETSTGSKLCYDMGKNATF